MPWTLRSRWKLGKRDLYVVLDEKLGGAWREMWRQD